MARPKMVTRTITATKTEVQIVSISKAEITTINVTVSGEFDDDAKLLKVIKKSTETDDLKVLQILSSSKEEKLYGMLESDFLKIAKELDPETRKMLAIEETPVETPTEETTDTTKAQPAKKETTTKGRRASKK